MAAITTATIGLMLLCLVLAETAPSFRSRADSCHYLCKYTSNCPTHCRRDFQQWTKRSLDENQFDDYSFEDYLFMKLLGRNLQG